MSFGVIDLLSLQQGGITAVGVDSNYVPITFPLTMPTSPKYRRFVLRQRRAQAVSASPFTLTSQVQSFAGERWECEISLPEMARDKAMPWTSFFTLLEGQLNTFMLSLTGTIGRDPKGTPTGSPVVAYDLQSGKTLSLKGCTPNVATWLAAGDWLQIGQRLHMVVRNASTNASGNTTLDIWPRLREVYPIETAIVTADPKGLFRLKDVNTDLFDVDQTQYYVINFSAEEAL